MIRGSVLILIPYVWLTIFELELDSFDSFEAFVGGQSIKHKIEYRFHNGLIQIRSNEELKNVEYVIMTRE